MYTHFQKYRKDHSQRMIVGMRFKKELLNKSTQAEDVLFEEFKKLKFKPKRQRMFFNLKTFYIVDFYFGHKKVCVEVDGGYHDGRKKYDNARDVFLLKKRGVLTLRFTNEEVFEKAGDIALAIFKFIDELPLYKSHGRKRTNPDNTKRIEMLNKFVA